MESNVPLEIERRYLIRLPEDQSYFPAEPIPVDIIYEDDDLICFYLHQNQRNLYELAAMDPTVMVSPEEYASPIWPENYEKNMESITLEDINDIKEPDEAEEDTKTSDTNK